MLVRISIRVVMTIMIATRQPEGPPGPGPGGDPGAGEGPGPPGSDSGGEEPGPGENGAVVGAPEPGKAGVLGPRAWP